MMSTPDWLKNLEPIPTNPYEKILHQLNQIDCLDKSVNLETLQNSGLKFEASEIKIIAELQDFDSIDLVFSAYKHGMLFSTASRYLNWSLFEKLVARIMNETGWETQSNFRFFGEGTPSERNRFEVDIIANKKPYVLVIDCKRYKNPAQSPMREAAMNQKERVFVFYEQLPIIHDALKSWPLWNLEVQILPVILTWKNHQLNVFENVPICSIDILPDFLLNLSKYIEEFNLFHLSWETYA